VPNPNNHHLLNYVDENKITLSVGIMAILILLYLGQPTDIVIKKGDVA
jgi:hypothetical protein